MSKRQEITRLKKSLYWWECAGRWKKAQRIFEKIITLEASLEG